ncbi:Pentatricopeptide repeat-containing protein [Raphanus sativus]|nr:Pentatricopeptide repeat-containing protein [Raphanus sativus]
MRFTNHIRRTVSSVAESYTSPASLSSGIRALVHKAEYLQALHLYTNHDNSSPLYTSVFTYPSLLKACSALQNLGYGKTLHASIIVLGLRHDPFVATSLVNLYVKCGSLGYAVQVFDGLSQCGDVTVWNSLIDGYFRFRRFKDGFDLFRRMVVLGVRPDGFSLSIGVSVLCKGGDFGKGKGNRFMGVYAWRLFLEVEDKSNVVLWNVMIVGFGDSGVCESSLELYVLAKSNGVKLVSTSFTGVLGACGRSENFCFGRQVHCDVVKMGLDNDPYVCTSLLLMYSKCGMVGEAETVFSCVLDRRLEVWNAMVAAYAENGYGHCALELFSLMREDRVLPDSFTLSNVIACCSMLGCMTMENQSTRSCLRDQYKAHLQ